jgi:hypothetical protein
MHNCFNRNEANSQKAANQKTIPPTVITVSTKSLIMDLFTNFDKNMIPNWLAFGALAAVAIGIAKVFWNLYGKSIQEWYQPHAKKHVEKVTKMILPMQEPVSEKTETTEKPDVPSHAITEEKSQVGKSAPNPPDYRKDYREDIIEEIKWEWEWRFGANDRPRMEFIDSLDSFCPKCGRRRVDSRKGLGRNRLSLFCAIGL